MLTVVTLLFLPALLVLTAWRACTLPRALCSGRLRFDPRHPWSAALALGLAAAALLATTVWLLQVALQAALAPPTTVAALFALGRPVPAFVLLCLVFEWVLYYTLVPRPGRGRTASPECRGAQMP